MFTRIKRGLKRRVYKLHPRSFLYDYYCRKFPNRPLMANIDRDIKARIWPGDTIGKALYIGGLFEEDEVRLIKGALKPGMVFLDIGANMGYYTLLAAQRVGPGGQVHSFEPSPRMFSELKFNVELNRFSNVQLNHVALGDKPGMARLSRYERGQEVYGSLSQRCFPGARAIGYDDVVVETLDNYMENKNIKQVDFMKMDVEGAELMVLRGAERFLKQFKPQKIVFEFVEVNAAGFGYRCEEILDFLRNSNYTICMAGPNGNPVRIDSNPDEYPGLSSLVAIR
jgi:FkbM family methyltransferase